MREYTVYYRIGGKEWLRFSTLRAKSPANAITAAAHGLRDITGNLEIWAVEI